MVAPAATLAERLQLAILDEPGKAVLQGAAGNGRLQPGMNLVYRCPC